MHFHLGAWSQRVEYWHWSLVWRILAIPHLQGSDSLDLRPYILLASAIRHRGHPFHRIHALGLGELLRMSPRSVGYLRYTSCPLLPCPGSLHNGHSVKLDGLAHWVKAEALLFVVFRMSHFFASLVV